MQSHLETLKSTSLPTVFVSFRRSQRRIKHSSVILNLSVNNAYYTREQLTSIIGNEVEFFTQYNTIDKLNKNNNKKVRKVYGVITRIHGNSNKVIAVMDRNLNPKDVGKSAYIKLYKRE